jgi:XTP/dITP diphosphohydrolase
VSDDLRPRRLVLATRNRAKGIEMAAILADTGLEVLTLADFPESADAPDVEETGCTYAENAELKARAATALTRCAAIADDAGLEIDALGGQPGVYSRRFLGEETTFPQKVEQILRIMSGTPDTERGCRFVCAVAITTPGGDVYHCRGVCEGRIAREQRGSYGFGYDPIFYLPTVGRHMAELLPAEKHRISHRGMALAGAKDVLRRIFG